MEDFIIRGNEGFIHIVSETIVNENMSGADLWVEFDGFVEIKCGNFYVEKSNIWFTFAEVNNFYLGLTKLMRELTGHLIFEDREKDLVFDVEFKRGSVFIKGTCHDGIYQGGYRSGNKLDFSISSDQSYFVETINQIKEKFIDKYVNIYEGN